MIQSLRRIPFFSKLPTEALEAVAKKLRLERYHKDEVVFVEGSVGDAMYLIESGQVKVVTGMGDEERILTYLGPGDFFGEMALLLGEPRSATVRVTIDAELWVLRKADLEELLEEYPSIALHLTRELSRRLRATDQQPTRREEYDIVAVLGDGAVKLGRSLARHTGDQVVVLDLVGYASTVLPSLTVEEWTRFAASPAEVGVFKPPDDLSASSLAEALGTLVHNFSWVLMIVPLEQQEVAVKALNLADVAVLCEGVEVPWAQELMGERLWKVADEPASYDRVARRIARKIVGLALSSGGARGIAHIGVLRVLEEAGVPIDIIAGTSAGSLFGGLYAAGWSVDDIAAFAREMPRRISLRGRLWDFCIPPRSGLIRGQRTLNFLRRLFEDKTFADLRIPLYVVAADILSGEEVVFDSGPVAEAVRASISIIGIFAPAHVRGRYLVDGGAVNPVPTSVLAQHGANIILASSVITGMEPPSDDPRPPSFLGVVTNVMGLMEREIIKTRMQPVDVVIRPEVEPYSSMQYDLAETFIRLGEEATRRVLPQIQALLAPRSRRVQ